MARYVALLRGIAPANPNMHNQKLREVLEELGFTDVKSVISSGNLLFSSSITDTTKLEALLEAAWPEKLGFASTTIIRSLDELQALVRENPFEGYGHNPKTSLNVTFLKHAPENSTPIEGRGFSILRTTGREVCSVIDTTAAKTTDYMAKAERAYGKTITTRTWKTIGRIVNTLNSRQ